MTHPTHGLDHNALEAAPVAWRWRTLSHGIASGWFYSDNEPSFAPYDLERIDGLTPLYALSQNPGTSNTSGEAVGVKELGWSRDDVGNDVATTICGPYVVWTEGIGAVGYWSLGYGGVRTQAPDRAAAKAAAQADFEQRILSALEPRASDREAVIEEIENAMLWFAHPLTDRKVLRFKAEQTAAAIRKLSEVSHEH